MIYYGEKPSNQSAFPVTPESEFVDVIRKWIEDNPESWNYYLTIAKTESVFGELSPNYPIQILRHRRKVSIPNAAAPILARLALEQDQSIRFRLAKSKYDAYFEVKL